MSSSSHHVIPISTYFRAFLILGALMVLTILVYAIDFGHHISEAAGMGSAAGSYINNAIALTIAIVKATIVVLYFMGVKYTSKLTKLYAAAGFVWLLLMATTFCDYFTRHWEPIQGWTPTDNEHAAPRSRLVDEFRHKEKEPLPKH